MHIMFVRIVKPVISTVFFAVLCASLCMAQDTITAGEKMETVHKNISQYFLPAQVSQ